MGILQRAVSGGDAKQSSEDHFSYDGSGNATYHSEGTTTANGLVDHNTYDSTLGYMENGGTDKSAGVSSHWSLDPNGWRPDTTHRNETGSDNGRYKLTFGDFTQDDISGDGLTQKLTKTNTDTYGENYNYHFTRSLTVNVALGGAVTTSGSGTGDGTEHGLAEHELVSNLVYDIWDGYGNWSHGETQTTDHSKYSNDYTEGWSESYATNGPPSVEYGSNNAPGRIWGDSHSTGSNQDGPFAPDSSSYDVSDSGTSGAPGMDVNGTHVAWGFHNTWPHPQVWQYNGHFGFGSPPSTGAVGLDIAKSLGVGGAVDPSTAQPAEPQAKEVTINGEVYVEFQQRQPDGSFKTAYDKKFNPVVIDNGPSGLTMYGHYLRHPGEMDSDLRTAQKVAVGVAAVSAGGAIYAAGVGITLGASTGAVAESSAALASSVEVVGGATADAATTFTAVAEASTAVEGSTVAIVSNFTAVAADADIAVIGTLGETAPFLDVAGFNVLNVELYSFGGTNMPWLMNIVDSGATVLKFAGGYITKFEVGVLLTEGYVWIGNVLVEGSVLGPW